MPTKPYYVRSASPAPFASTWNPTLAKSCDEISINGYDREEITVSSDGNLSPPPPPNKLCFVANPIVSRAGYSFAPSPDTSYFGSQIAVGYGGIQTFGMEVPQPGKEGGWMELYTAFDSTAKIQPLEADRKSVV